MARFLVINLNNDSVETGFLKTAGAAIKCALERANDSNDGEGFLVVQVLGETDKPAAPKAVYIQESGCARN